MSLLEKAIELLEEGEYAGFFILAEESGDFENADNKNVLNTLKLEYKKEGDTTQLFGRCKTLAQDIFKNYSTTTQKRFLTDFYVSKDFIGREKDLENLHQLLKTKQPTVVVNGMGGMGKTALAKKYVEEYQNHYDYIIWLEQQSSLLNAFISEPSLLKNFHFSNETESERFQQILHYLQQKQGKKLLIVDNYAKNENEQETLKELKKIFFQDCSILFTSREKVYQFEAFELGHLPQAEAIELFEKHCDKYFEEKELVQVLEIIDYHTLTIELLAKNYANSWDLENLQQVSDILEQKKLDDALLQELIKIGIEEKEIKLYTHLVNIFDVKPLSEEAIYLLKQFAVLPNQAINGKQLLEWLEDTNRKYRPALEELAQKAWLQKSQIQNTPHFEMPRLIQMLMLKKLSPSFQDTQVLFESVLKELSPDKTDEKPLTLIYLIDYAMAFLENISFGEYLLKQGDLQDNLARLYNNLGLYKYSEVLYEISLNINKKVLGKKDAYYALSLNNLASSYHNQGKYIQAEKLFKEALEIHEKLLDKKHKDYAISLNNLGGLYYSRYKYQKDKHFYKRAKYFYKKALDVQQEILGKNNVDYAKYSDNLALLYVSQGRYKEAEPLHQEAVQTFKEYLGEKHTDYATSLNNLGYLYHKRHKYKEAEPLLLEAFKIRKEILSKNHFHYLNSLDNLRRLYYDIEAYEKAEELIDKSYKELKEFLGEEHPNTQSTKKWLEESQKNIKNQIF